MLTRFWRPFLLVTMKKRDREVSEECVMFLSYLNEVYISVQFLQKNWKTWTLRVFQKVTRNLTMLVACSNFIQVHVYMVYAICIIECFRRMHTSVFFCYMADMLVSNNL